jgi:hypothetical protein
MNTLNAKPLPEYETMLHIAFGCGCVQTFHVEQLTLVECPIHGDRILSTTEELVRKAA